MTRNQITTEATPEQVFDVLLDPKAYSRWVVGAKRIRGVDPTWPQPGSRFHHTVGAGPAQLDDSTKVLRLDPPRRFVLEVRFRPAGVGNVDIEIERDGDRHTQVSMTETPVGGPVDRWWNPVLAAATSARNTVSLRRLRRLAERKR